MPSDLLVTLARSGDPSAFATLILPLARRVFVALPEEPSGAGSAQERLIAFYVELYRVFVQARPTAAAIADWHDAQLQRSCPDLLSVPGAGPAGAVTVASLPTSSQIAVFEGELSRRILREYRLVRHRVRPGASIGLPVALTPAVWALSAGMAVVFVVVGALVLGLVALATGTRVSILLHADRGDLWLGTPAAGVSVTPSLAERGSSLVSGSRADSIRTALQSTETADAVSSPMADPAESNSASTKSEIAAAVRTHAVDSVVPRRRVAKPYRKPVAHSDSGSSADTGRSAASASFPDAVPTAPSGSQSTGSDTASRPYQ